ncbi:hypothetical protein ACIQF6_30165 [Kitasatospora sp. NPDC092948]|uniref:hypothetical protein n=1 Tax=Kitasatospora sp. NPDC092948 TaxID=3364088 RepID=UPI0038224087
MSTTLPGPAADTIDAAIDAIDAVAQPKPQPPHPTVHVRALITWLAVYPAITTAQLLLGPSLGGLAVPLRVLVITALVVPTVVYLLVPGLMKVRAAVHHRRRR